MQALIIAVLVIPIACGLWTLRHPEREQLARLLSLLSTMFVFTLFAVITATSTSLTIALSPEVALILTPDSFGSLFGFLTAALWIAATVYSLGYFEPDKPKNNVFFAFFSLSQAAIIGIALAGNMITLYLFYEMLTFLTYPLVTHKGTPTALHAGRTYMLYSLLGAGLILTGIIGVQSQYGDVLFTSGLPHITDPTLAPFAIALILGFGVKAGLMPMHAWLPQAMIAPTPVSALLHAVAVVKSGVFGIIRVMYCLFGATLLTSLQIMPIITALSAITIIIASVMALGQDVLKRRLAYSTIAQLAYITFGASLLTQSGISGALLHMINHALLKLVLFCSAGLIITRSGIDRISGLGGAARRFPITFACFTFASLGMVGVLPTNGFLSKWHLMSACIESGQIALAAIFVVSALLAALYLLPICISAYLNPTSLEKPDKLEAPVTMIAPIIILTLISVTIGIWPTVLTDVISTVATSLMR